MVNSIGYNYNQYNPYNLITRQFSGTNAITAAAMLSGYQDDSLISQTTSIQTKLGNALKEVRESFSDLKPAARELIASNQDSVFKKTDSSAIVSAVKDFADKYNDAVGTLQDNTGLVNNRLLQNLTKAAGDNKSRLADIGITVNKDKTLTIDTDKLEQAISSNLSGVKTTLGSASGLASKVAKVSTNTLAQPMAAMVNSNKYANQLTPNAQYQAQISQYLSRTFTGSVSQLYGVGGLVDTVI